MFLGESVENELLDKTVTTQKDGKNKTKQI